MSDEQAMVVQFPHPGREHVPRGDEVAWNAGGHGRKFIAANGDLVNADGRREHDVDFTCWVEWEPPSAVIHQGPADGGLPRALHRPWWTQTETNCHRQNTDPWVFGDQMLYSNCRQLGPRPHRNPSAMQRLHTGSVILFGSTINGDFCLDTAFVVATSKRLLPSNTADLDVDDAFRTCVIDTLRSACDCGGCNSCTGKKRTGCNPDHGDVGDQELTLYRGATIDDPVHGMYSFVPALRTEDDPLRFARPAIELPGIVNPKSTQAARGPNRRLPIADVVRHWTDVRAQVLRADLDLAVRIQTPERRAQTVIGS